MSVKNEGIERVTIVRIVGQAPGSILTGWHYIIKRSNGTEEWRLGPPELTTGTHAVRLKTITTPAGRELKVMETHG